MRRLSAGPLAAAVLTLLSPAPASAQGGPVTWRLDNLSRIGGQAVEVVGSPRVVDTPHGAAVEFNGRTDGLLIARNPIQGLTRFTIEVLFEPDPDGAEEQRFLHIEQDGGAGRALIELRMNPDGGWALDTYLRTDARGLTLLDRARLHRPRWTTAALTYDGTTMAHYVDGVRELSGEFAFAPAAPGVTSIGVRRNLVSWFKGRIHTIRFTPDALTPERMLRAGGAATVIPLCVHTAEDARVPLENSLLFFAALRKAGVPAEMHLYEKGPHGFGAGRGQGTASGWVTRCIEWMASHGWLEKN